VDLWFIAQVIGVRERLGLGRLRFFHLREWRKLVNSLYYAINARRENFAFYVFSMKSSTWTVEIKDLVNARLKAFFAEKRHEAEGLSPRASELVDEIAALTMRGGKRLRAAVLSAGYHCASSSPQIHRTVDVCAAIELLQSYLLVHDDWMDQDDERRGGPSMHSRLRTIHKDAQLGDSLAVLAGDLASGYAWELLNRSAFPEHRVHEAFAVYEAMHQEVVFGQQLDLLGFQDVELMYRLKSGSYTVRGPLRLGAILGEANDLQLTELDRFSEPLGIAFQLRDDLLSVFGDSEKTGKRKGNDLRAGKNTLLVAEARKSWQPPALKVLHQVLGNRQASDAEVAEATELLKSSGARERVEQRLDQLLKQARDVLHEGVLHHSGIAMLGDLVELLVHRDL
jgi:geranylgeranyl diphosphate synthase type I